jgi:glycosyltransferase involved in cell wall biosynthesis
VTGPGLSERLRQTRRLLGSEGAAGVTDRLRRRAAKALEPSRPAALPIPRHDLVRAAELAESGEPLPEPAPHRPGEPLTVAWVCSPPSAGGGGHTTMFRMAAALERAGHRCILYFQVGDGWTLEQHRRTTRAWWPWLEAEVRDLADGIDDAHAVFATGWASAYAVLASPANGKRFYFVQDFEPSFYPAGSESLLAEATYRFGFHGVTAGRWLAQLLRTNYGMAADHFDFGCDLERYSFDPDAERTSICHFSFPEKPRRAHTLALSALDLFASRHPEVDIHLYGQSPGPLPFRALDHGLQTPDQLNELYNRCAAGLVLSATNVSLVPLEMLAAGCIPVMNDAEHNRLVLDNDHVAYAPPTPFGLAAALSECVERSRSERAVAAAAAAASVATTTWERAGAQVERVVREVVEHRADHDFPAAAVAAEA